MQDIMALCLLVCEGACVKESACVRGVLYVRVYLERRSFHIVRGLRVRGRVVGGFGPLALGLEPGGELLDPSLRRRRPKAASLAQGRRRRFNAT